jgi:hypothetical protein
LRLSIIRCLDQDVFYGWPTIRDYCRNAEERDRTVSSVPDAGSDFWAAKQPQGKIIAREYSPCGSSTRCGGATAYRWGEKP